MSLRLVDAGERAALFAAHPLADQIACVAREIAIRESVYPKWVTAGRMTAGDSIKEIGRMRAALETLKGLQP